jgi:hypothetical protein
MNDDDTIPLVQQDPWLTPFADALRARMARHEASRAALEVGGGLCGAISEGHRYFGLNRGES